MPQKRKPKPKSPAAAQSAVAAYSARRVAVYDEFGMLLFQADFLSPASFHVATVSPLGADSTLGHCQALRPFTSRK